MARTRSAKGNAAAAQPESIAASTYSLPPQADIPSRFFILPKNATAAARIVTLQNPRYAKLTRYLLCPKGGFFEFTKINPKSAPRSWLLENGAKLDAQVFSSSELYVATPIDPLFLLLPALIASQGCRSGTEGSKRMFLSSDDHFDAICDTDSHLTEVLSWPEARDLLVARMEAVCDTVQAGDEPMFRLNDSKIAEEVLSKAQRMSDKLPKSMEEKFVTKALEAPIVGIRTNQPGTETKSSQLPSPTGNSPHADSADSQSTVSSVETSASSHSEASTAATSLAGDSTEVVSNAMVASAEVVKLQKLRVAFDFICSSYVTPSLAETLKAQISTSSMTDFKHLDEYMAQLTRLRQEATATRSTDYSRKRTRDEESDDRAEKKRKKEEEEKIKKANQSRGVRELAKVNTSGMRKLSDFFKKK